MDSLYRENIIDHFRSPSFYGRIKGAQLKGRETNASCGDEIELSLKLDKDKKVIEAAGFVGRGCALSIAAASMLMERIQGETVKACSGLDQKVMLKMMGVEVGPTRLKCVMLPLDALKKAIKDL